MKRRSWLVQFVLLAAAALSLGISIDPVHKHAWGENIGWLNWRDANATAQGVVHHGTHLSGYIWAENVGYIHLGSGAGPYANTDHTNYGVNIAPDGVLSGLAWGENIGWINFGTAPTLAAFNQHARFDQIAGRFRGYAWGENVGWINLDDPTHHVGVGSGATIVAWRSVRTHAGQGELSIPLDPSAVGNGSTGPTTETRVGGIQLIAVDFDSPVTLVDPGAIVVLGWTTTNGAIGDPVAYAPQSVSMLDADTMLIAFPSAPAPGALPDQTCYRIVINSGALSEPLFGDDDVYVRALVGDTTSNGVVNLGDALFTKERISQPALGNPEHDIDTSGGAVALQDVLAIKSLVASPARMALCP